MREIRIEYKYQHRKDLDYQYYTFTLEQIENSEAKEYTRAMNKDGYSLVDRTVSSKREGRT